MWGREVQVPREGQETSPAQEALLQRKTEYGENRIFFFFQKNRRRIDVYNLRMNRNE